MDLNLTPAEEAFRQEIRAWFAHNLPHEWKNSQVRALPEDDAAAVLIKWQRRLGEAGWLGLSWPVEYGGRGATLMEQAIYLTEGHHADAPLPLDWVGLRLLGPTLMDVGTPELRARYLNRIVSGQMVWCQGFSEPNAGSDLAGLQTRAVLDGDHYVANGHKIWSTTAQYADWCMLLARTNPAVPKHKGITMFTVDMKSPGVTVRPIKQIAATSEFNEIFFDNVRIPRDNVIGGIDNGWGVAMRALTYERGLYTMINQAKYRTSWQEMVEHARKARAGGKSLLEDRRVREQLAQSYADIELMRLTNLRYITRYLRGIQPAEESSLMKLHWAMAEQRLYDLGMTLGGPAALAMPGSPHPLWDGSWNLYYFQSRSVTIYGGTTDIQRNLIAERIYGLPR
jgi:alkylation response protein AidB-like acyl-CoA dehydrogenase